MITKIDITTLNNTKESPYESETVINSLLDLSCSFDLFYLDYLEENETYIKDCEDLMDLIQDGVSRFYFEGTLSDFYKDLKKYSWQVYKAVSLSSGYTLYLDSIEDIKDFLAEQMNMIIEQTDDSDEEHIKALDEYVKAIENIETVEQANEYEFLTQYSFE